MFYSPKQRQDNSPYDRWSAKLISADIQNITTCIADLSSRLFSTIGTQIVSGQKTFTDLYFKTQNPTYDSIMSWINHDISPVFGAGGVTFSDNIGISAGRSIRDNVSGVVMDMALQNPVFSINRISITGGTDNRGKCVLRIDAPNVPLAAFDGQKLGAAPELNNGYIQNYYWATSKNCSGTIMLDSTGDTVSGGTARYGYETTSQALHNIVAAYNESADKVDLLLVHKSKSGELPAVYKSMAILGQIFTGARAGLSAYLYNTYHSFINGILHFHHNGFNSTTATYSELDYIGNFTSNSCIAYTLIPSGRTIKVNGLSLLPANNSAPGETSTVAQPLSKYHLYIPLIFDTGTPPSITEVPSKGNPAVGIVYVLSRIIKLVVGRYFI